jgi:hypothetical protein
MFIAILGDRQSRLPANWTKETAVAVAAETSFDATAGAGQDASLTFVGLFGDLQVQVPPGSRVNVGGVNILGDKEINVSAGDGPDVRLKVYGLFSDVRITDRPS